MNYWLTDEWNQQARARAVPGSFYSKEQGGWVFTDPTPRAAAVALKLFPHLITQHPELLAIREQLAQDVRPIDYAAEYYEQYTGPGAALTPLAWRTQQQLAEQGKKFYQYQLVDLTYLNAVLKHHGAAYLGWDRGMGKTLGTCALIDELDCQRTLIVCPNTAKQSVWAAELHQWCPWVNVIVLPNEKTKRERLMVNLLNYKSSAPYVLVIHYEALAVIARGRSGDRGWDRYGEWDLVVADEAHRISNPQAKMSRTLKKIKTKHKLALSGSVIQNHAEELFSQLQWLYPDRYSSKWRDWNDRYLDYVDSGYANVCVGIRIERLPELRDELGRFMVYRRKEDELDLPPLVEETRKVELSRLQRKVYDDLAETYFADLGNEEHIKAANAISLLTKLRQVATGLDLVGTSISDSAKLDLATELITDNPDEAFVVFSWFKGAADALAERLRGLGVESFVVTGDTKQRDRADAIERFQAGERRVFIGTISTLGESVTLSRASNVIFLDRSWNPAANDQAKDRCYRIGQTRPVTVTYIVAADTVDEYSVTPTLTDKQALRRMVLGQ